MLRIISGEARGVSLEVPSGWTVRPTADRLKGAVFSMVGIEAGDRVLDLFAGSGNLGLEALSRGASSVVLVEQDREALQKIEENCQRVKKSILGWKKRAAEDFSVDILAGDALSLLSRLRRLAPFDLIFADPPYIPEPGQRGPLDVLNSTELAALAGEALLILESGPEALYDLPENLPWELVSTKEFSRTTTVSFWRAAEWINGGYDENC